MESATELRVTVAEMRHRFNRGRYFQRRQAGELRAILLKEKTVRLEQEEHPVLSQIVSYRDQNGSEVARVHQYLRRDGTLAESGKPDPKRLMEGGVIFRLQRKLEIAPPSRT